LQIEDLRNRVRTRSVLRWQRVTWAGFATLAFGVTLIAILAVFVVSLLNGRPEDTWLLELVRLVRSTLQTSSVLRGFSFMGRLVAAIAALS
jgi:hypothetical protein